LREDPLGLQFDNWYTLGPNGSVDGHGVAGGAYIGYRVIRMIPSLFPVLWWTLPMNAAML
jgi:hypothetical protein